MDFSKFKTSDWLKVGGAVVFLIFGFMSWITIDAAGIPSDSGANVFDFFWTGTLPWILVMGTGIITFLAASGMMKQGTLPWPLIMLLATGVAALLLLIRLIANPLPDEFEFFESLGGEVGRGIGMIGSVVGGCLAFAGAFIGYTESGGNLSDLKDMNKMKSQFSGGGNPPPPPPGMPPPPPPR